MCVQHGESPQQTNCSIITLSMRRSCVTCSAILSCIARFKIVGIHCLYRCREARGHARKLPSHILSCCCAVESLSDCSMVKLYRVHQLRNGAMAYHLSQYRMSTSHSIQASWRNYSSIKRYLTGLLLASVGALSRSRWACASLLGKVLLWLCMLRNFPCITGLSQTFPGV